MLRSGLLIMLALLSTTVYSATESSMRLLDNRFRVDPTIKQITFLVYREKSSQPVVLVRPDGRKYYAWKTYPNLRWYQESNLDIISIDNPMPGPWQAVGKVTPRNNIRLVSHLTLNADSFPNKLYRGEEMKFSAKLLTNDEPLLIRDFLDRVNLKVTFSKYIENEEELVKEARPIPIELGTFADDGLGSDEKPADGVFTVTLPIDITPGKYRARITSGNGVFLRAKEQVVLVYPNPVSTTFIQSRNEGTNHRVTVSGEEGVVAPGSLAVHLEHKAADGFVTHGQGQASEESLKVSIDIENHAGVGKYAWHGRAFATDASNGRELQIPITEQTYSVVKEVDIEEARKRKEAALAEKRRIEMEKAMMAKREADRKRSMIIIAVGNVLAVILGIIGWFVWRKIKAKRAAIPEMQLEVPKK